MSVFFFGLSGALQHTSLSVDDSPLKDYQSAAEVLRRTSRHGCFMFPGSPSSCEKTYAVVGEIKKDIENEDGLTPAELASMISNVDTMKDSYPHFKDVWNEMTAGKSVEVSAAAFKEKFSDSRLADSDKS